MAAWGERGWVFFALFAQCLIRIHLNRDRQSFILPGLRANRTFLSCPL